MDLIKEKAFLNANCGDKRDFDWIDGVEFSYVNMNENSVILIGEPDFEIHPSFYRDDVLRDKSVMHSMNQDNCMTAAVVNGAVNKKGKVKIIAIGDSASFVCAAAGGMVVQRAEEHYRMSGDDPLPENYHEIKFSCDMGGEKIMAQSSHMSMMYPFAMDKTSFTIHAYKPTKRSELKEKRGEAYVTDSYRNSLHYLFPPTEAEFFGDEEEKYFSNEILVDPEVVEFHNIGALCIHPNPRHTEIDWGRMNEKLSLIVRRFLTE